MSKLEVAGSARPSKQKRETPGIKKPESPSTLQTAQELFKAFDISSTTSLDVVSRHPFVWQYPDVLPLQKRSPEIPGEIVRIKVPRILEETIGSYSGQQLLLSELVDCSYLEALSKGEVHIDEIDLIYDHQRRLIAAFPVANTSLTNLLEQKRFINPFLSYIDFSSYHFNFSNTVPGEIEKTLERIRDEIEPMTIMINTYRHLQDLVFPRGLKLKNEKTLVLLDIDTVRQRVSTRELFHPSLWALQQERFDSNQCARDIEPKKGHTNTIISVYPTVYFPAGNRTDDEQYYSGIFTQAKIKPGERVCVCGSGSGVDTLIAAHCSGNTVFATDVNPLAVANITETAALAGYTVNAKQADVLTGKDGLPVFPGTFDVVLWNMPSVDLLASRDDGRDIHTPRSLSALHDNVGSATLFNFVRSLQTSLKPKKGRAFIWGVPQITKDLVTGREVDLLERVLTYGSVEDDPEGRQSPRLFEVKVIANTDLYRNRSQTYLITFLK